MARWAHIPAILAVAAGGVRAQEWATLARSPARDSRADAAPAALSNVRWTANSDDLGRAITFEGQSGVVLHAGRVFALGRSGGLSRVFCFRADTGQALWSTQIPAPTFESWTTPSIDTVNATVLVASGRYLTSLSCSTGTQVWQTQLQRSTGGATPAITTDRGLTDRAFITDFDGFGGSGRLYCINLDAAGASNPFTPGEIVWSVVLGSTGANSPAYADGVVYIACVSDASGQSAGRIQAFDAAATTPPAPLWTATNPADLGFFGGVSVAGGAVFAASYAFAGGQFAANLVKIDAATGALCWSTPCNRTDSIPVPLGSGLIALSTGIRGFGSIPSIQLFRDNGPSGQLEWDSAYDSWIDANLNQQMDPGEYIDVGGWTIQPVLATRSGVGHVLLAGVHPAGASTANACPSFRELDLGTSPSSPDFVRGTYAGAGSSPAAGLATLYTIGPNGLFAFGSPVCYANCDASTASPFLTANDFQCFMNRYAAAESWANCDGSTATPALTANDFQCFLNAYAAGCT